MEDRFGLMAWDKKGKKMVIVTAIDWGTQKIYFDDGLDRFGHHNVERLDFHNIILLQCTGIKDKNEKLIYGGDLFYWLDRYYKVDWDNELASFIGVPVGGTGVVFVFDAEMIGSVDLENLKPEYKEKYKNFKLVIAGNVFENPELLEEFL